MQRFEYLRATGLDEAFSLLKRPGARILAGGTTLIDLMKLGVEIPSIVIDIGALGLQGIELVGDTLSIGALVTNEDAARHPLIKRFLPAVSQSILSGASGQIRNAATIGGNLLQRTRCAYFRSSTWACNKRVPGSGCPARYGVHSGHALLGTSRHCIATHPSDMAVALLAADAKVRLKSSQGERLLPLDELYLNPGDTPDIETSMLNGELILGIEVDLSPVHSSSMYLKLRGRASYEFATVSVAAGLTFEDFVVSAAAVAMGGVAVRPWRNRRAELLLVGKRLTDRIISDFCDAVLSEATALPGNSYKIPLARGAIERVLKSLNDA
jgi:xanthine dehydrogenase YagS FAD-binding subunit